MEVKGLRTLALEIFKNINKINLDYMKNVFTPKTDAKEREIMMSWSFLTKLPIIGDKSLTVLGPKIWNQLPQNINSETCFSKFKEYIDT